jgi:hypothetical protein
MKNVGQYAKSLVPLLITALYAIQSALSDGKITNTEWAGIATGLLTSLGAYLVPNAKPTQSTQSQASGPAFKPAVNPVNVNDAPGATVTKTTTTVTPDVSPLIPPDNAA